MTYRTKKLCRMNFPAFFRVARILKACGDDMYEKYGLVHWKHSFCKTLRITYSTARNHTVYGIFDGKSMLATFGVAPQEEALYFSKFAVIPHAAGKGLGSFCLDELARIAREEGKTALRCDVYDKSRHAYDFYVKRGFAVTRDQSETHHTFTLEKQLSK